MRQAILLSRSDLRELSRGAELTVHHQGETLALKLDSRATPQQLGALTRARNAKAKKEKEKDPKKQRRRNSKEGLE